MSGALRALTIGNRWLWLLLLAGLIATAGGLTGTEKPRVLGEQVYLRWGYNILQPTGQEDPQPVFNPLPAGYRIETVLAGLDRPSALAATPDGRLLVAEQAGTVRIVEDGRLLSEPFVSLDVFLTVDLGLVGITVDPEFTENGFVYFVYPADDPRRTVVARVRDEGGRGTELEEIFSWEDNVIQHTGGGLRFMSDGTLLVGLGDHERINLAQSPLSPIGSILRITRDGEWPADNPFIGPVFAYGLRNPFSIAIDPETGRIFAGENGFMGQDAIVEVKAGAYYGWPGPGFLLPGQAVLPPNLETSEEEVEEPLLFYHNSTGMAGLEFYSSDVLSEFKGHLFFCQVNGGGALHELEFNDDGSVQRDAIRAPGCMTGVTTGADGFLYFLNYIEGRLYRIAVDSEEDDAAS
jgi:glucose/arabinose dehydrogenase